MKMIGKVKSGMTVMPITCPHGGQVSMTKTVMSLDKNETEGQGWSLEARGRWRLAD